MAYDMLVAACRDEFDVSLTGARENAIHALDYFVDNCIEDTGLPNGIYNVDTEQFVYWWIRDFVSVPIFQRQRNVGRVFGKSDRILFNGSSRDAWKGKGKLLSVYDGHNVISDESLFT